MALIGSFLVMLVVSFFFFFLIRVTLFSLFLPYTATLILFFTLCNNTDILTLFS